jgi:SAM-dependent methyltransferase
MDILPDFLAHIDAAFDGGVLVDHASSDGTGEILSAWCAARPSWRFGRLNSDRFRQAATTNAVLFDAFESGADVVMCIDADEFVRGSIQDFRDAVEGLEGDRQVGFLRWRAACPANLSGSGAALDAGVITGDLLEHRKLVIPRWIWRKHGRTVGMNQGNHSLLGLLEVPLQSVGELLHLPIRSEAQLRRKVEIAMQAYAPQVPAHILALADLAARDALTPDVIRQAALAYGHSDDIMAAIMSNLGEGPGSAVSHRLFERGNYPRAHEGGAALPPLAPGPLGTITLDDGRELAVDGAARGVPPKGISKPAPDEDPSDMADVPYTDSFFLAHLDGSLRSALEVLRRVFGILTVDSVLDVGCGFGAWLRVASDLGAETIVGVDGDYVDTDQLVCPPAAFRPLDLRAHRLTLPDRDPHVFDLVCSMEVAEHLPPDRAETFVEDLCAFGDTVLFSAAVPGQGGTDHVNEQWPDYWAWLFARRDFDCFDFLRPRIWRLDRVEWWYRQNTLLFARRGSHAHLELSRRIAPTEPLSLVHPGGLQSARDDLRIAHDMRSAAVAELEEHLVAERRRADAAEAAVGEMTQSRSWRLTAPIRRVRGHG